jgi:hypothetical protein
MRLYHYTRYEYLPSILKDGLDKGEVNVTLTHHINGVWLTDSLSPRRHGLGDQDGKNTAKLEYRITVELDPADPKLHRYRKWAVRVGLDPKFMRIMRNAAGPDADDYSWWIYFGTIAPPFAQGHANVGPDGGQGGYRCALPPAFSAVHDHLPYARKDLSQADRPSR